MDEIKVNDRNILKSRLWECIRSIEATLESGGYYYTTEATEESYPHRMSTYVWLKSVNCFVVLRRL